MKKYNESEHIDKLDWLWFLRLLFLGVIQEISALYHWYR